MPYRKGKWSLMRNIVAAWWCPNSRVGLEEANDPRNYTNEHEFLLVIFRDISWIVFDLRQPHEQAGE
jgi:hypothetical protein